MARKKQTLEQIGHRTAHQEWAEEFPLMMLKAYGYQATKATAGMPGVDGWVHKTDGESRIVKSARIQSKYTRSSGETGFLVESPHFDFLLVVQDIKSGYGVCLRDRRRYWVIPKDAFLKIWKKNHINISDIDPMYLHAESVDNIWQPIIDFLEEK